MDCTSQIYREDQCDRGVFRLIGIPSRKKAALFCRTLIVCFSFGVAAQFTAAQDNIHLYIRAFIPKDHPGKPGYVRQIPSQPTKFVIPSPIPGDDSCFLTDNRSFSSDINASSRIVTEFVLVVTGTVVSVEKAEGREIQRTGPSHKVNCTTGVDIVPSKSASTSHMSIGHPAFGSGQAQIVVDGRASNPLVNPSPEIQYGGHFTFDTQKKTLRFEGSIAQFPAYEIYAQMGNGPVVTILQAGPAQGSTAKDLIDFGTGIKLRPVDTIAGLK